MGAERPCGVCLSVRGPQGPVPQGLGAPRGGQPVTGAPAPLVEVVSLSPRLLRAAFAQPAGRGSGRTGPDGAGDRPSGLIGARAQPCGARPQCNRGAAGGRPELGVGLAPEARSAPPTWPPRGPSVPRPACSRPPAEGGCRSPELTRVCAHTCTGRGRCSRQLEAPLGSCSALALETAAAWPVRSAQHRRWGRDPAGERVRLGREGARHLGRRADAAARQALGAEGAHSGGSFPVSPGLPRSRWPPGADWAVLSPRVSMG